MRLVADLVAAVQEAIGLPTVGYQLGGIESPQGNIDLRWLAGVLFARFGVGALVFCGFGGKSRRVHQLDNYAGGHFPTADIRHQYSNDFYAGLMLLIGSWYRGTSTWLEGAVASTLDMVSYGVDGLYRTTQPMLLVLVAATGLLVWVVLSIIDHERTQARLLRGYPRNPSFDL